MFAAGYRTAAQLAQDSGVNASTLSEALSGTRAPSPQTLKRVLEACGLAYNRDWAVRQERAKNAEAAEKAQSRRGSTNQSSEKSSGQHSHTGHHSNSSTQESSASQVQHSLSLDPPRKSSTQGPRKINRPGVPARQPQDLPRQVRRSPWHGRMRKDHSCAKRGRSRSNAGIRRILGQGKQGGPRQFDAANRTKAWRRT